MHKVKSDSAWLEFEIKNHGQGFELYALRFETEGKYKSFTLQPLSV